METLFNQFTDNFEVLKENEMDQVLGGHTPREKDIFDPDEQ